AQLLDLIGDNGVLLYPSYTRPAPRHYLPVARTFDWVYTGIINVMQLPSTQVPLGLNAKGLPLGIQVVGAPGHDHETIAVAMELERQFGGWVPPWEAQAAA
ncbi:MAG: amidase family protein, partial [Salinisphaeraceae bacterium]|nr:amidase family protein [Salinisphaeraceae bacterium]